MVASAGVFWLEHLQRHDPGFPSPQAHHDPAAWVTAQCSERRQSQSLAAQTLQRVAISSGSVDARPGGRGGRHARPGWAGVER